MERAVDQFGSTVFFFWVEMIGVKLKLIGAKNMI
jgi:hypothetical protein